MSIFKLQLPIAVAIVAIFISLAAVAQSPPVLRVDRYSTGLQPLGVATSRGSLESSNYTHAVVANSGDNSVSIFRAGFTSNTSVLGMLRTATISGIPSPFTVAVAENRAVVTSPSDDAIRVISILQGTIVGRLQVGPQPHAVACKSTLCAVSNLGDNSLVLFDPFTLTITARIPNVSASRGVHGVSFFTSQSGAISQDYVWVAGTDSNIVTIVSARASPEILARIPVIQPMAVLWDAPDSISIASAAANRIVRINPLTLQSNPSTENVPHPQDLAVVPYLGGFRTILPFTRFATAGDIDSVWMHDSSSNTTSLLADVPGATGLAAASFSDFQGHTYHVVLVTARNSNSVLLLTASTPSSIQPPNQFLISDAASFATGQIAPGALGSLFVSTGTAQNYLATSLPLPKTLGGVTLRFGGSLSFDATSGKWNYSLVGSVEAGLVAVHPTQINFQIPPGISLGDAVPAQITKPDGTTLLTTLRITATAPGIFSVLMNGQGQAAVLNQDNSQNFGTNPARRGSVIQIFATGAGETDPPLLPGEAASVSGNPLVFTRVLPQVTIGGIPAPVQFSGMAPGWVGLWQINVQVPQEVTPGSAVPLTITAGGISSNTVTIAVE